MDTLKTQDKGMLTGMSNQNIIDHALEILESRLARPDFFVREPADANNYLKLQFNGLEYESFRVLFLNNQHGLITLKELFRGTIDSTTVYPREVVKAALHFNSAAVILAHNHPSGECQPSQADKTITKRLIDALRLMDIRVLDHIIVGGNDTLSFAEQGLL